MTTQYNIYYTLPRNQSGYIVERPSGGLMGYLGLKEGFYMQKEEILYLERVTKAINNKILADKERLEHYENELKIIPDDDENKFSMATVWVETFLNSIEPLSTLVIVALSSLISGTSSITSKILFALACDIKN